MSTRKHQDNQLCWCGDDHTWLADEDAKPTSK